MCFLQITDELVFRVPLIKLWKKIVFKKVYSFLIKHKILYDYQFGFREYHSTTLALIELYENIIKKKDEGKLVAGIYLDLKKHLTLSTTISCQNLNIMVFKDTLLNGLIVISKQKSIYSL